MMKYRADKPTPAPDGSVLWHAHWMGGPTLSKVDNCRLESLAGDMRRTAYVTGEPDTWFSIPAVVRIQGCRVKGYLTQAEDEQGIVFRHQNPHDS
jgi:hypothetical protein